MFIALLKCFLENYQPRPQGLSSYRPIELAPGGGKMRYPGNEVGELLAYLAYQVSMVCTANGPRSIYQYSNMAPSPGELLYLALFSFYSSLFWELRDKRNFKSLP